MTDLVLPHCLALCVLLTRVYRCYPHCHIKFNINARTCLHCVTCAQIDLKGNHVDILYRARTFLIFSFFAVFGELAFAYKSCIIYLLNLNETCLVLVCNIVVLTCII